MNSLVGYGLSSDSESEGDGDDGHHGGAASTGSAVASGDTAVKKTRNFLLESNSASSESESESESAEAQAEPSPRPPQKLLVKSPSRPTPRGLLPSPNKLPPPPLSACAGSSVFANPFKIQADEKLSVLQKHVPLTLQAKPSQIGGKRMCVAYRKDGRCRFGIKCKFAHDSDLQTSGLPSIYGHSDTQGSEMLESHIHGPGDGEPQAKPSQIGGKRMCTAYRKDGRCRFGIKCKFAHDSDLQTSGLPSIYGHSDTQGSEMLESHIHGPGDGEPQSEGDTEEQQGRKRRVGLSNTLIPPKRAMKQFAMQRDRERHHLS